MRKILLTALLTLALTAFAVAAFVNAGVYSVAADQPHATPIRWLLDTARARSIERHAAAITVPYDLADPERVRRGAGNYDAMCVACHLRPGLPDSELSRGLSPSPPDFAVYLVRDPAAAFWVTRHGITSTAMPAWGVSMDDESIWDLVAFLRRLPSLDADGYRALVEYSDGHSHGIGEVHDDESTHDHTTTEEHEAMQAHEGGHPQAPHHPAEPSEAHDHHAEQPEAHDPAIDQPESDELEHADQPSPPNDSA